MSGVIDFEYAYNYEVDTDRMDHKKITFRPFDADSAKDCELMAAWENDLEIRDLFQVFRDEEASKRVSTSAEVSKNYQKSPDNPTEQSFMILLDGEPVGEMNFFLDRKPIMTPKPNTAWAGIVVGEVHARGCGIGRIAMQELEQRAKTAGAKRMELGVFEHNNRAISFYQSLGYREFARLPDYTFANGKKWADIRMIKEFD